MIIPLLLLSFWLLALTIGVTAKVLKLGRRIKTTELRLDRANNDIKTLHRNELRLQSSIRELQRILRKYDKDLKQHVRVDTGAQETKTQEA